MATLRRDRAASPDGTVAPRELHTPTHLDEMCEQPIAAGTVAASMFASGAAALVFQLVWIRELRLVFGATTAASAAVTAIFMAGLGLGNALLGRRVDAAPRPLRFYGLLEVGISFSAGISPLLIAASRYIYVEAGGQATFGPTPATLVRLAMSAAILAVPTYLMGGTLPAAAKAVAIDADAHRRRVAWLYGLNTLGAVVGAALANFVLLEAWGSRMLLWSACLLNLALGAAALAISRRSCRATRPKPSRTQRAQPKTFSQPQPLSLVCAASAIVGCAFFLMEIVWYRMLGPLLGGTTYTFGLILCVALLGIGIGGALYTVMADRLRPSRLVLATTCALEALCLVVPYWYGDRTALWVLAQQSHEVASFGQQVWNWFQVGAFVMLPPAILSGFQFPLLIALAGSGRENVARDVGFTFAANTVGAIVGSLAGGFFLLPVLTAPGLWQLVVWMLAGLAAVLAALEFRNAHANWRKPAWLISVVASLVAMFASLQEGPTPLWRHSGIGAGRARLPGIGRNAERDFAHASRRQCIWQAEGIESSVAITSTDSLAFIVNGKSDGNAFSDAGTQIGLGLLGPLLHRDPQRGLVIGLGTGETVGWLADVVSLQQVDVVELEPWVTSMAERCRPVNRNALANRKLRLHYNDAREFLLTTPQQYDLIISEPSNPYRAGIANLYTREFYQAATRRLSDQGLFLQWLQGYEVDDETVRIVLHTLRSVFPRIQVWRTQARDMVLVCGKTDAALAFDAESLRERFAQPTIHEGLSHAWRVDDVPGLLAHYVCGTATIEHLLAEHTLPWNTDDRNLLEYAFAKTVGQSTKFSTQKLQSLAITLGDSHPAGIDCSPDLLVQRRLAMCLLLGGEVVLDEDLTPVQRRRGEAYQAYLDRRYEDAGRLFQSFEPDTQCPIERVVWAHTLAECGQPVPTELLESILARVPAEALALEALTSWHQNQKGRYALGMAGMCVQLRSSPWGSSQLLDAVLRIAAVAAEQDRDVALQAYEQLAEPFAMHRLNEKRLLLRYLVSESLDDDHMVAALATLEPHVPWKGWLLENRARVYANRQHPLARFALRDLQRYQSWAGPAN